MTELPLDKVLDFLKRVRPFSELPDPALKGVIRSILIDYFPEGEVILSPGKADDPFLYLVFSGIAHCFIQNETHTQTLRYVSEGDHFGSETILTGRCEHTVQVKEDAICYLVRPEVFLDLEERFEGFRRYFKTINEPLAIQISQYVDLRRESAASRLMRDRMRSSQFKTAICTLMHRKPVCCEPNTSASEIARIMGLTGVGSVIVMKEKKPLGIVTKNDLTEKVLARGRGGEVAASEIMSKSLMTMDFSGSCFEASLRMVENHCHHMVAIKGDDLYGVISQHDLILLQGANPVAVVGRIDKEKDLAGLERCVRDMSIVQQALLAEGGRIADIWALMTTFRDALTRRLTVIGIEEMRKEGKEPPVLEFCWITFGTPGRKETLLRENFLEGFIYNDPEKHLKNETQDYFSALALKVKNGLAACALLHPEHGELLCLPESRWKLLFAELIEGNIPLDSKALRLLDFRGVCAQRQYVDKLRDYVFGLAEASPQFIERLKGKHRATAIPVCFYGDEVVASEGYKETLALKDDVLMPLVDTVRALALENGIRAPSTSHRITTLSEAGIVSAAKASDLKEVYQWLVRMSLQSALEEEKAVDWLLDPHQLSSDEKKLLTESFRLIKDFVETASRPI